MCSTTVDMMLSVSFSCLDPAPASSPQQSALSGPDPSDWLLDASAVGRTRGARSAVERAIGQLLNPGLAPADSDPADALMEEDDSKVTAADGRNKRKRSATSATDRLLQKELAKQLEQLEADPFPWDAPDGDPNELVSASRIAVSVENEFHSEAELKYAHCLYLAASGVMAHSR